MDRYEFLRILTKSIQDSSVRAEIAEEINSHLDEQRQAYIENGMDEKEAEREAVISMGEADEIGKSFASIYQNDVELRNMLIYIGFSVLGFIAVWGFQQLHIYNDDEIIKIMFVCAGYLMMVYGLITGAEEKALNLPFWYSKNQSGGFNLNSYSICVLGTALVSRNYFQWFVWTILLAVAIFSERKMIENRLKKIIEKYIWKTGIAETDILHKGKATINGELKKVYATKTINKGAQVVVVNLDGFHLMVEEVKHEVKSNE